MKLFFLIYIIFIKSIWATSIDPVAEIKSAVGEGPIESSKIDIKGWKEFKRVSGDLDDDKVKDLVMIFRKIVPPEKKDVGVDETQALLVFKGVDKKRVKLQLVGATHLYDNNENFMESGGLNAISIEKKVLTVSLESAMSMGSWYSGGCTEKWRFEKDRLRLIGLAATSQHRATGSQGSWDWNLLTGDRIAKLSATPKDVPTVKKEVKKSDPIYFENFILDHDCVPPELPLPID